MLVRVVRRISGRAAAVVVAASAVLSAAPPAAANGRLPNTTQLDISPHDANLWLLGLTNGMALSRDGGRSFRWLCENVVVNTQAAFVDAQGFQGGDYRVLFGRQGEMVVEGGNAAARSTDGGMTWSAMADLPRGPHVSLGVMTTSARVPDLAMLPVYNITTEQGGLWQTTDAGRHWRPLPLAGREIVWTAARESPHTAGHWLAVGATFFQHGGPYVAQSHDDGKSWEAATRWLAEAPATQKQFGLPDLLWHPGRPSVMVFRGTVFGGRGDLKLVRSVDGGRTGEQVLSLPVEARGMAATADGAGLYLAATDQNVWRSRDAGATWRPLPTPRFNACVARVGRLLFLCGNQNDDGFSLGVSLDGGDTVHRAFMLDRLAPAHFPAGSAAARQCPPVWPSFAKIIGAGGPVAGADPRVVDTAALLASADPAALLAASPATQVVATAAAAPPAPPAPAPAGGQRAATPVPTAAALGSGGCSCQQAGAAPWAAVALVLARGLWRRRR